MRPKTPNPDTIREARHAAGLTQSEAGKLVHTSERQWQKWEYGEHRMHAAIWELFLSKVKNKV